MLVCYEDSLECSVSPSTTRLRTKSFDLFKGRPKISKTLFSLLSKRLLRKQKLLKMTNSLISETKWRNSPKSRCTLWQNNDYWSKDCFPLACQISCKSDIVAQMISTSAFISWCNFKSPWEFRKAMAIYFTSNNDNFFFFLVSKLIQIYDHCWTI